MKNVKQHISVLLISLVSLLITTAMNKALAQDYPPGQPGVEFILVTFDQPPSSVDVQVAPLRYNKDFALSLHADDGIEDVFTLGFRYFSGINGDGTNYPGLFYTDGCGNDISFKLSSALFSYSGFNNEDMHQPGNFYGAVTWPQLELMAQNNFGIYNHGFTSDAFTDPEFMSYSIRRNESYIRRQLLNAIPGGVQTRVHVNPNGAVSYTAAAFNEGYSYALRLGSTAVIPNDGIDVNSFAGWDQNLELNREIAENVDVTDEVDVLAASSIDGANYWKSYFTHSLETNYPQSLFLSDFNYIATTYGKNGADNIWMTTEEEVLNYLRIRQAVDVSHGLAGNTLLILLEGEIPSDMRYYALSLVLEAEGASITNIEINGGTNNTFNGIGEENALINLEWNGRHIFPADELADYHVSIAETTQVEYDALVAMDYVLMVPEGDAKEALRERLCNIPDIEYEDGFCIVCEVDLGPDQEICQGECIELSVPEEEGTTYLWSDGSTGPGIEVCPMETTDYWVQITTAEDCIASDTITITVLEAPVFDLGGNQDLCVGSLVSLEGPFDPDFTYAWFLNDEPTGDNTHLFEFTLEDTVSVRLEITAPNTCVTSDEVNINAVPYPVVDLGEDFAWCQGDSLTIEGPVGNDFIYEWLINGLLSEDTTYQLSFIVEDTVEIVLNVSNPAGCSSSDTLTVFAQETPFFDFGDDMLVCIGDTVSLEVPFSDDYIFVWYANNELIDNDSSYYSFVVSDTVLIHLYITAPSGCMASDSMFVFAAEVPQIVVNPQSATLCFGDSITLDLSTTGAEGFVWWDGSEEQTRIVTPPVADSTYYYWAEAYNGFGCVSRDTAEVHVFANPMVELTILQGSTDMCAQETLRLFATKINGVNFDKIIWNDGDTLNATTNLMKEFQLNQSDWFTVTVISSDGCIDSDSIFINVYPLPNITVSPDQEICNGETIILQASGGASCTWFDGSTPIGQGYTIEVSPTSSKIYTAVVTDASPGGCEASSDVVVTVNPAVDLSLEASELLVCAGEEVVLTASGAETYDWEHGDSGAELVVKPMENTTYTVTGTNSFGCSQTASISIEVRPVTQATLTGLVPVYCLNDAPATLVGSPVGGIFTGNGIVGNLFRPNLAGDGVHTISYLYINQFDCLSADSMQVRVFGGTTAIDLGNDTLICPNDFLTLDAGPGFNAYYWSTGDTTRFISVSGNSYVPGTTRTISVVGELDGCTAAGNVQVGIRTDCFVDLEEHQSQQPFTIIPNPNSGDFIMQLPDDIHNVEVSVYDSRGVQHFVGQFDNCAAAGQACRIQLPGLTRGVYMVNVNTGTRRWVRKMVVM